MFRPHTVFFAVLAAAALPALAQTAQRPSVKVGDSATYAMQLLSDRQVFDSTVLVRSVDEQRIVSTVRRSDRPGIDAEQVLTRDPDMVKSGSSGRTFSPSAGMLRFPLTVGDRWKAESDTTGASGDRTRNTADCQVFGVEKVPVPAGEFDAMRVECKGWINGVSWTGSMRWETTQWYAPEAARTVKTIYKDWRGSQLWTHSVSELKSVSSAP